MADTRQNLVALVVSCLFFMNASGAFATSTPLKCGASKNTAQANEKCFQKHPKLRSTAVGAGVGVAAGAVTGLVTHKGVMRGAVIGAGAGAGIGAMNSSTTLRRHPIAKDVATGAVAGIGLAMASSRGHRESKRIKELGAVGAALGLGSGLLKDKLRN